MVPNEQVFWTFDSIAGVEINESPIQSLHSTILSEAELKWYRPEFESALSDSNIRNIAVSGPFGAGKSTVVDSWERDVRKREGGRPWVHVSLAWFSGESDGKRDVESELINQLVHKVGKRKSPKSRFRVTRDTPAWEDALKALFAIALLVLTFDLILVWGNPASWPKDLLCWQSLETFAWAVLVLVLLYWVFRHKSGSGLLKRVKVMDAEIELQDRERENASAFDRYMDDVVYLLASSGTNVIVFEDLDRFGDVSIFEKLRRVNELANARRFEGGRGAAPIRFLYLLRDGLFDDPRDRTKFFDLIISVIPYVDPSNAFDILKRGLARAGLKVDESFLYQLSLFIDDPRILQDICNESYHYKRVLYFAKGLDGREGGFWSDEKLVAMTAYKVLFPTDYESLQVRQGYVYSLFERKGELVESVCSADEKEIEESKSKLEDIKQRFAMSEDELKLIYAISNRDFRNRISNSYSFNFKAYSSPRELIEGIKSDRDVMRSFQTAVERLEESNSEYTDRMKELSDAEDAESKQIAASKEKLERHMLGVRILSLSDLLDTGLANVDEFFGKGRFSIRTGDMIKEHDSVYRSKYFPMLRFFIVQGFIDESYELYMSNRYNESLSPGDEAFVFSILSGQATDPTQAIDDSAVVVMRLSPDMLSRRIARNWAIFNELLVNGPGEKREAFLRGVSRDHDSWFVCRFILSGEYAENAFAELAFSYDDCVADVLADPHITDERKRDFCHVILGDDAASSSLLKASREELGKYASSDRKFLELGPSFSEEKLPRFEESLESIDFRAGAIDFEKVNGELVEFVAQRGLFVPNKGNVLGITRALTGDDDLRFASLNSKLATDERLVHSKFRGHVLSDIEAYLSSLLSDDDASLDDGDVAIAMVLNAPALESSSLVETYAELLTHPLGDLRLIDSPVWRTALLKGHKCADTAENACAYLYAPGFDGALASFLTEEGVPEGLGPDFLSERGIDPAGFLKECALSDDLGDSAFESIADSFSGLGGGFNLTGAAEERAGIAVRGGVFAVTADNVEALRESFPSLVPDLAATDIESYADLVLAQDDSGCAYSDEEVLELLDRKDLDSVRLARLTEGLGQAIPLSVEYADDVNLALLQNGKFDGSMESLLSAFRTAGEKLRAAIVEFAAPEFGKLLDVELDDDFALELAEGLAGNDEAARRFATARIRRMDDSDRATVRALLEASGLDDYVQLVDGHSITLMPGEEDLALIEALRGKGMCGKMVKPNANGKCRLYPKGHLSG